MKCLAFLILWWNEDSAHVCRVPCCTQQRRFCGPEGELLPVDVDSSSLQDKKMFTMIRLKNRMKPSWQRRLGRFLAFILTTVNMETK